MRTPDTGWVRRLALRLGEDGKVIEPRALADEVRAEAAATLALYGAEPGRPSFAFNCLLARRLVERGVRFINLYHEGWDHHSDVAGGLKAQCGQTDRAAARPGAQRHGLVLGALLVALLDPVELERRRLVPAVDEDDEAEPALPRIGVFIQGGSVKAGESVRVFREMAGNPIDNQADVVLMAVVNKVFEIVR